MCLPIIVVDSRQVSPFHRPQGPYGEQRYSCTLFLTSALEGGEESASRPARTLPPGKTRYPLYRRLGGPQGRSGQVQKISPPLGFDPRTVQPVGSRYTDYATRPTVADNNLRKSACHVIITETGYEVGVQFPGDSHTDIQANEWAAGLQQPTGLSVSFKGRLLKTLILDLNTLIVPTDAHY